MSNLSNWSKKIGTFIKFILYRQIGKHESYADKTNLLELQRKFSFTEQICHCINLYLLFKNTLKNVIQLFSNQFDKSVQS